MKTEVRKYLHELSKAFKYKFILDEYTLCTHYEDKPLKSSDSLMVEGTAAATINVDGRYLNLHITYYPLIEELYLRKDYDEIIEIVCHEFCHTFTEPLYIIACQHTSRVTGDHLEDVRERQTQRICNVIMTQINKKELYPDKLIKKRSQKKKKRRRTKKE